MSATSLIRQAAQQVRRLRKAGKPTEARNVAWVARRAIGAMQLHRSVA